LSEVSAERSEPGWEHFQHGADIGIRGIGPTKEQAFRQAAMALTAVITDPARVALTREVSVECEAPDDEILLMDWLNALIYEMSANQLVFGSFDVRLEDHYLHGRAWGEKVDVERHEPAVEVKGATFTGLSVARNSNRDWVAQCVVDV
jgi:tRNA nucleotidyltransferase (CCA-adding enzyme)